MTCSGGRNQINTRQKEQQTPMSDETMEPKRPRELTEAADECERELNVRRRCFPRWVKDGRVSATDAQDRVDRLASAVEILRNLIAAPEEIRNTVNTTGKVSGS